MEVNSNLKSKLVEISDGLFDINCMLEIVKDSCIVNNLVNQQILVEQILEKQQSLIKKVDDFDSMLDKADVE